MTWLQALLLGLVQGLTEFLPVSSSGHLAIGREILGVEASGDLVFEVAVHAATVLATIVVFRKEIGRLCQEIKMIENENDELYGLFINKLFRQHYSLTDIIIRKDTVQVLENTTNSLKYISDKLRAIISEL